MGGLHSGRKRQHTCIDDCLEIDIAWLKKRKFLQPGKDQSFTIIWRKWRETNFKRRTEQEYKASARLTFTSDSPTLTLAYQVGYDEEPLQNHKYTLRLVGTPCNYGGQRWWFTSPCCGRRVRVLYINTRANITSMTPQCRDCLELHYPSQCASYQERHASYERHLLRNFGYYWAEDEYRFMPEHYFELTPEWVNKAKQAQLLRHLQITKLVIRCESLIIRDRITTLKKLSVEGRREYFEHLAADPDQTEELAEYTHLANILIAQGIIPADDQDQADPAAALPNQEEEVMGLRLVKWMAEQEETEQELKELEALAA